MANPSRRTLFRSGVLLAAAAVPLGAAREALSMPLPGAPTGLRRAAFLPHVGTRFVFGRGDARYPATLTHVGDVAGARAGNDKAFRLVFETEGARPEQGTYRMRHGLLRDLDLFISPIGARPGVYEAVVNTR